MRVNLTICKMHSDYTFKIKQVFSIKFLKALNWLAVVPYSIMAIILQETTHICADKQRGNVNKNKVYVPQNTICHTIINEPKQYEVRKCECRYAE